MNESMHGSVNGWIDGQVGDNGTMAWWIHILTVDGLICK